MSAEVLYLDVPLFLRDGVVILFVAALLHCSVERYWLHVYARTVPLLACSWAAVAVQRQPSTTRYTLYYPLYARRGGRLLASVYLTFAQSYLTS